jgi:hypothetical protein
VVAGSPGFGLTKQRLGHVEQGGLGAEQEAALRVRRGLGAAEQGERGRAKVPRGDADEPGEVLQRGAFAIPGALHGVAGPDGVEQRRRKERTGRDNGPGQNFGHCAMMREQG